MSELDLAKDPKIVCLNTPYHEIPEYTDVLMQIEGIAQEILGVTTGTKKRKGLAELNALPGTEFKLPIDGISGHINPLLSEYIADVQADRSIFDINFYLALKFHDVIEDSDKIKKYQETHGILEDLMSLQDRFPHSGLDVEKVLAVVLLCSKDPKPPTTDHRPVEISELEPPEQGMLLSDLRELLVPSHKKPIESPPDAAERVLFNTFNMVINSDGRINQQGIAQIPVQLAERMCKYRFIRKAGRHRAEYDNYLQIFNKKFEDEASAKEILAMARKIKLRDRNQSLNQDFYVVNAKLENDGLYTTSNGIPSVSEGLEYVEKTEILLKHIYADKNPELTLVEGGFEFDQEEIALYKRLRETIDLIKVQELDVLKGIVGNILGDSAYAPRADQLHPTRVLENIKDFALAGEEMGFEWEMVVMLHDIIEKEIESLKVVNQDCLKNALGDKYPRLFTKKRLASAHMTYAISVVLSSHFYEVEAERWRRQLSYSLGDNQILTQYQDLFPDNFTNEFFISRLGRYLDIYRRLKEGGEDGMYIDLGLEELEYFKKFYKTLDDFVVGRSRTSSDKTEFVIWLSEKIKDPDQITENDKGNIKILRRLDIPFGKKERVLELESRFAEYALQRIPGTESEQILKRERFRSFLSRICTKQAPDANGETEEFIGFLKGMEIPIAQLDRLVEFLEDHDLEGLVLKASELLDNINNPKPYGGRYTLWRDVQELISFYAPLLRIANYKSLANECYDVAYRYIYHKGFGDTDSGDDAILGILEKKKRLALELAGKYSETETLPVGEYSTTGTTISLVELMNRTMTSMIEESSFVTRYGSDFVNRMKEAIRLNAFAVNDRSVRVKNVGAMLKKLSKDEYNNSDFCLPDNIGFGYMIPDEVFTTLDIEDLAELSVRIAKEIETSGILGENNKIRSSHPGRNGRPIEIKTSKISEPRIHKTVQGIEVQIEPSVTRNAYQAINLTFCYDYEGEEIHLEIQLNQAGFSIIKRLDDLTYKPRLVGFFGSVQTQDGRYLERMMRLADRSVDIAQRHYGLSQSKNRSKLYINKMREHRNLLKLLGFDINKRNVYGEGYFDMEDKEP